MVQQYSVLINGLKSPASGSKSSIPPTSRWLALSRRAGRMSSTVRSPPPAARSRPGEDLVGRTAEGRDGHLCSDQGQRRRAVSPVDDRAGQTAPAGPEKFSAPPGSPPRRQRLPSTMRSTRTTTPA